VILIVTEQCDPHTDFVEPELDRRGLSWVRLHLSDFPTMVTASYPVGETPAADTMTIRDKSIDITDISAVWYRRTERFVLPKHLSSTEDNVARDECQAFVQGLWAWLGNVTWISEPFAVRAASCKAEQLLRVRRMGFRIPKTLFSNDPIRVREFVHQLRRHDLGCVYKPHNSIIVEAGDGKRGVAYTRLLGPAELDRLEEIRLSPGIFQEYVDKHSEFRVTVVGDQVFGCRIESQAREATQIDWRAATWNDPTESAPHVATDLPGEIETFCRSLVHSYGLRFGAIDLIVTPGGDFVFLELNPNGQWAWIEQRTGLPIASALVDELAS
jgi:glutathione synthase/RimK-type ligase-like ATP-grasp enzyme